MPPDPPRGQGPALQLLLSKLVKTLDDSDTHEFPVAVALDTAANDDSNMDVVLDTEPESSQTEDSD